MSDWVTQLLANEPGIEREVLEQYTQRLLALARQRLPDKVRARVDPEDVVQSVYRSFFRRLRRGDFRFDESSDVWRLLSVMTFRKARRQARFHQQGRRDVRRELQIGAMASTDSRIGELAATTVTPEDTAILFDCLEQLLARVPDNYRTIAVLRLEGNSIAQIAQQIGRSERTVLRALGRLVDIAAVQLQEVS